MPPQPASNNSTDSSNSTEKQAGADNIYCFALVFWGLRSFCWGLKLLAYNFFFTPLVDPLTSCLFSDEGKRNLTAYANLPPHIRDALSKYDDQEQMGTALPTVWMGLENDL